MAHTTPIVALDVSRSADALAIVDALGPLCRFYKVGLELFTAEGPAVVGMLRERGCEVFLDIKLHDIPNTVRGAARSAARLGVRLLTVHASGGRAMVEAAVRGAEEGAKEAAPRGGSTDADRGGRMADAPGCGILAVSVLTSMDATSLAAAWGREPGSLEVRREVLRLATLARDAGAHGLVCSGEEAAAVRAEHGDGLALLVPGIRFAGAATHDQARVVTPRSAAEAGARYIVLGRAVTGADDPARAMRRVLDEIA